MQAVREYWVRDLGEYGMFVRIGDRRKMIRFQTRYYGGPGCTYVTADPEEQQAIEASKAYRHGLVRLRAVAQPQNVTVETVKQEVREYANVKKVQQAANVLIDEYGASECDCENKQAILALAGKLGVSFPNLK